jgi:hypothetical protein
LDKRFIIDIVKQNTIAGNLFMVPVPL